MLQLVLLLIVLIVFQVFKPTGFKQKSALFLKLIGCVVIVILCAFFVVNMNEDQNKDLEESQENFSFLAAYFAVQVIIGYVLPGLFVHSSPSLVVHFKKAIRTKALMLSNIFNGFKSILFKENRVGNCETDFEMA